MTIFFKRFLVLMMCLVLLAACTTNEAEHQQKKPSEETKANNTNAETKSDLKLDSIPLPKNLEEVIAYPVGPYASYETEVQDKDVQKALNAIPALSKNAGDQEFNQLFSYLYSLFKMEYQDPKQALKANTISQPESGMGSKENKYNKHLMSKLSWTQAAVWQIKWGQKREWNWQRNRYRNLLLLCQKRRI